MIKYCETCALRLADRSVCALTNLPIEPKDFCSKHQSELKVCDICGQPYIGQTFIDQETKPNEFIFMCGNCWNSMGTCATCVHSAQCAFETDPSPLPHLVMQTIQNGNMTMQTQIRNPEREKITCQAGCSCYDSQIGCIRNQNFCSKYTINIT